MPGPAPPAPPRVVLRTSNRATWTLHARGEVGCARLDADIARGLAKRRGSMENADHLTHDAAATYTERVSQAIQALR